MASILSDAAAEEIARHAELRGAGAAACAGADSAEAALARLQGRGLVADAVAFLAHALPKREAVWWALLCVWDVRRPEASPSEASVYRALVRWLRQPNEEHRRDVEAAGKAAGATTLPGVLARAAFVSGGSVRPPHLPMAAPPPHLTAILVRSILAVAASGTGPRAAEATLARFLRVGKDVAEQENRWTPDL